MAPRSAAGVLAVILLTGAAMATTTYTDEPSLVFYDIDNGNVGATLLPQIDLHKVSMGLDDGNVEVTFELHGGGDDVVYEQGWIFYQMWFGGEGIQYGVLDLSIRYGRAYDVYLFVYYDNHWGSFFPVDWAWDAAARIAVLTFPASYLPGTIEDIYFESRYAPCTQVAPCTAISRGPAIIGDRMPNEGYYPPFNPETGVWG